MIKKCGNRRKKTYMILDILIYHNHISVHPVGMNYHHSTNKSIDHRRTRNPHLHPYNFQQPIVHKIKILASLPLEIPTSNLSLSRFKLKSEY